MDKRAYPANFMEVSTRALQDNAQTVQQAVGVPVIGVVKFDGYGVSLEAAAKAWQSAGVRMFAVSESWEALQLRQAGFGEDILLLAPVSDAGMVKNLLENNIILTVSDLQNARFYLENKEEHPLRVHIKVDTGMGRFGVRWTNTEELKEIYALEGLQIDGIFSHFGKSFEKEYKLTKRQLDRFLQAVQAVEDAGFAPGLRHIANSCAALRFPETRLDAVRVGSALVGALIAPVPVKLKTVHTCKAQVVALKKLEKGDTMGYASVCKAKKDTTAAVVAIGQSHGFRLTGRPDPYPLLDLLVYLYHLLQGYKNQPCAVYNDRKLPLIGRVGSQYTLFDATGVDVKPGDYVTVPVPLLQYNGKREYV